MALPPAIEKVMEDIPGLAVMMPPAFPVRRSIGKSSNRSARPTQKRIKGALLNEDIQVFGKVSLESLTGWMYSFFDFVSPSFSLFCFACLLNVTFLFCSLGVEQRG